MHYCMQYSAAWVNGPLSSDGFEEYIKGRDIDHRNSVCLPLYPNTTFISVECWPLGVENWRDHVLNWGLSEDSYRKCHRTNWNKPLKVLWFWINCHCRYQGGLSGKHLPFKQGLKKGMGVVCKMEEGSSTVKREVSEWSLCNGQCYLMLMGAPWWACRK